MKTSNTFVSSILLCSVFGAKLPSDFQICKREDSTELNTCLKSAIQAALPKLKDGIPALNLAHAEPLEAPSATIGEGKGPIDVVHHFKNIKVYGVTQSTVDDAEISLMPKTFNISALGHSREYSFQTHYMMDGQIFHIPVQGEGQCKVTFENPKPKATISGEIYNKKGKEYLKVTEAKIDFNPEKVIMNFDHLFNGNEVLGNQINTLLNENWKDVYVDLKEQFMEIAGAILANYVNSIFSQVPLDDLFPK